MLRHEHTLSGPKAERLQLLRATKTNISPIWSLYQDTDQVIADLLAAAWRQTPLVHGVDSAGTTHSLRRLSDADVLAEVHEAFSTKVLFIADGHHRYETALTYASEERANASHEQHLPSDFVLMMLTEADGERLLVLPTHRMVHGLTLHTLNSLEERLHSVFTMEQLAIPGTGSEWQAKIDYLLQGSSHEPQEKRFVLLAAGNLRAWLLQAQCATSQNSPLETLDVWLAHHLLLEGILQLDAASIARQEHITYTRDAAEAFELVRAGREQLALFLAPTAIGDLLQVARAGMVMPQKSTYFYPKPATGLVMRQV